jgi:hypothetical protein
MPETIQSVLSEYFQYEAKWRLNKYQKGVERGQEDVREKCSSEWLSALATFIRRLPDDDPGIRTLASFGWPVRCFTRGAGTESAAVTRTIGYKGAPDRPIVRPPDIYYIEKAWVAWVSGAERDAYGIGVELAIIGQCVDETSRSRLKVALGRFWRGD